jgi:hypothetical protein
MLSLPAGTFSTLGAGLYCTCGVETSGAITCWGDERLEACVPPADLARTVSISETHGCALGADQTAVCWGDDSDGQASPPPDSFASVSAGLAYACGSRLHDGTVICWGHDEGATQPPSGRLSQLSCGRDYCGGIRDGGAIECWGRDGALAELPPSGAFVSVAAMTAGSQLATPITGAVRGNRRLEGWGAIKRPAPD